MKLLLVEDNAADVRLMREMLKESRAGAFQLQHAARLQAAVEQLRQEAFDVVLLDLGLPDSQGMETVTLMQRASGGVPVVVLTGLDDEELALETVRAGAQDFLVKGRFDTELLLRTIRYAVERKRIEEEVRRLNAELEQRVAERTTQLQTANRTLDGINRIFREALQCHTAEELGCTCLHVAEEITGSQIGFVGEIGTDGLLHDLAISDLGWELCALLDKAGHRRPPGDFKIHGLYGRVLKDGKSVLANQPAEHPDSIGTPPGHPRLTAFLGVPLVDGDRVVGMIAVGNRPGGYRQADREALEALAPAVVEALHRKRTERALVRSEKLVSVGRLAATIAHEINNPLAGATNAVYLVASDKSLSAEGRNLAQIAERELRRAAQTARRILGFYREPNSKTAVLVQEMLNDLVALYEPRLKHKAIQLRVRCSDQRAAVFANPGEMRQLFSNLLANSIDALGASGTVYIHVKPWFLNSKPYFRITVADNGSGIERHHLRRVFEPFFTTKKDIGSGLGLWICDEIAKRHGGNILVRSRVGKGTVFCVRLPAAAAASTTAPAAFAVAAGKHH